MSDLAAEVRLMVTLPSPAERKVIRQRARVTTVRMAEELGVQPLAVKRWENGTREPRGELRLRYARLLRMFTEIVEAAEHEAQVPT